VGKGEVEQVFFVVVVVVADGEAVDAVGELCGGGGLGGLVFGMVRIGVLEAAPDKGADAAEDLLVRVRGRVIEVVVLGEPCGRSRRGRSASKASSGQKKEGF